MLYAKFKHFSLLFKIQVMLFYKNASLENYFMQNFS